MTGKLAGRSALITGGSMGLGYAIAEAFVEEGARVMITGRTLDPLQSAVFRLTAGQFIPITDLALGFRGDVGESAACDALMELTLEHFPDFSILVNNAGVYGPMGPLEENDWEDWVRAININLLGSVYMARAVLPHFKKQGYGKIIQISGGGATAPLAQFSAYAASKAAVVRFAETLAEECRGTGVTVNSMAPGVQDTRLTQEAIDKGYYFGPFPKDGDMKRATNLAVWLASADSDGITGKLISAIWDEWPKRTIQDYLRNQRDAFTLRRAQPS